MFFNKGILLPVIISKQSLTVIVGVLFQNSALYKHLQDVGYTEEDVEVQDHLADNMAFIDSALVADKPQVTIGQRIYYIYVY